MSGKLNKDKPGSKAATQSFPPGRIKITEALKLLLEKKDFNAITWAEIAKAAGVNEALIYKYFQDKRNLLHEVLKEYLKDYLSEVDKSLMGVEGALNKLRRIIASNLDHYNRTRVFAKILLLEVRNFPGYFQSETYRLGRDYARTILGIIKEGVKNGEIRSDVSPSHIQRAILGTIEHLCIGNIVFDHEMSPEILAESACRIIFQGIETNKV